MLQQQHQFFWTRQKLKNISTFTKSFWPLDNSPVAFEQQMDTSRSLYGVQSKNKKKKGFLFGSQTNGFLFRLTGLLPLRLLKKYVFNNSIAYFDFQGLLNLNKLQNSKRLRTKFCWPSDNSPEGPLHGGLSRIDSYYSIKNWLLKSNKVLNKRFFLPELQNSNEYNETLLNSRQQTKQIIKFPFFSNEMTNSIEKARKCIFFGNTFTSLMKNSYYYSHINLKA